MTADPVGGQLTPAQRQQKLQEGGARIAEIDLTIARLQARRQHIVNYCAKLGQIQLPQGEDPAQKPEEYSEAFEQLWKLYAAATGRHVEKRSAFSKFKKISADQYPYIRKAIENYARSRTVKDGYSKHFVRFLKDDFWPIWINKRDDAIPAPDNRSPREIAREVLRGKK